MNDYRQSFRNKGISNKRYEQVSSSFDLSSTQRLALMKLPLAVDEINN